MIERQFISQNMKEHLIHEYIAKTLSDVGFSHAKLVKTPAGVKIIIYASRPGLIVGKKGANIKELTQVMKTKFSLENPQVEIAEVENVNLDPRIVAERIKNTLERFGTERFKGVGHKIMADVMNAGARGIEVIISGKVPSARAKSWRFYSGYLKKCGDVAISGVRKAIAAANLKTGTVGIQVTIMPPETELPDKITIYDEKKVEETAAAEKKAEEEKAQQKEAKKRTRKKKEVTESKEEKSAKKKKESKTKPEEAKAEENKQ
jgi:small subunit ribosomal protein S3